MEPASLDLRHSRRIFPREFLPYNRRRCDHTRKRAKEVNKANVANIDDLGERISELNKKSTQILVFLSFALVVAATLRHDSSLRPCQRAALDKATRWWTLAIFPTLVCMLPLKEIRESNLGWYRILRWLKFFVLWAAIVFISLGAFQFLHTI